MADDSPHARRWTIAATLILTLSLVVVVLTVFSLVLRHNVNDARRRVLVLENGTKIAQVATCYAGARGRPQLTVILRGFAALSALDKEARLALSGLVNEYESNTPTLASCDALARKFGLNPKDFPAPGGGAAMIVRRGVFYVMVATLIILFTGTIAVGYVTLDNRHDVSGTKAVLSIGCGRANRTRDALHWMATNTPGIPPAILDGLNLKPEEKPQPGKPWLVDCDAAYP